MTFSQGGYSQGSDVYRVMPGAINRVMDAGYLRETVIGEKFERKARSTIRDGFLRIRII